jgi:hypothetical protein
MIMKNLWEVIHRLIDGPPITTPEERAQAHQLVDTHLAQHLGIARELGEHRDRIGKLES